MKSNKPRELNESNLREICRKIDDLEYFIFFGTLLGHNRDGRIIDEDDDVDIMINKQHHNEIRDILIKMNYRINIYNKHIIQGCKTREGRETHIDFYFYENFDDKDFIVERWNFFSRPNNEKFHLHIPKSLIYPISKVNFLDFKCKVPSNSSECCRMLYGEKYLTPMKHKIDYIFHGMLDNVPNIIYLKKT